MAFNTYGVTTSTKAETENKVDFDAINRYVVETANLQERETLVGYISQIVDLGTQDLPDAEKVFKGDEEEKRKIVAQRPDTYFKNGFDPETRQPCELMCWPQKPQQCVAFAVDFPEIIIDKGQFFGESKPLPLRIWMGNQFYIENTGMVVGRPTPLKVTNLDKTRATKVWSMAQNSLPYKMAVAAKLIKPGEAFLPQRIDELLGKSFQFSAQVWFKESKGKEYYNEYVNFVGALGRGQKEAEHLTVPYLVQFNELNSDDAIKELRSHIVNTIKRASNYQGSKIQGQIEAIRGGKSSNSDAPKAEPRPVVNNDTDNFDDSIPF